MEAQRGERLLRMTLSFMWLITCLGCMHLNPQDERFAKLKVLPNHQARLHEAANGDWRRALVAKIACSSDLRSLSELLRLQTVEGFPAPLEPIPTEVTK